MMMRADKSLKIYVDGAARGNPGESGIGVLIMDLEGNEIVRYAHYLGSNFTNNRAEYQALLHALQLARAHAQNLQIYSDSQLMVEQMKGNYKVKHPDLKPLYDEAQTHLRNFSKVSFTHVPREQNKIADQLANQAIDEKLQHQEEHR